MRIEERQAQRRRFNFCSAYCGIHEHSVGAELTVEHFQPSSKGGDDEPENWVYCCHACNEFKGEYWQPESPRRILQQDDIFSHLTEEADGKLRGLTETGSFHIARLQLNRDALVEGRRERRRDAALCDAESRERDNIKKLLDRLHKVIARIKDSGNRTDR